MKEEEEEDLNDKDDEDDEGEQCGGPRLATIDHMIVSCRCNSPE